MTERNTCSGVRTRSVLAVLVAVLALSLSGCGTDNPGGTVDPTKSAVSMEKTIRNLTAMRTEIFDQLNKQFGKRDWKLDPGEEPSIGRAGCPDDSIKDGETAFFPNMGIDGSYPESEWKKISAVVIAIGKKYGFNQVSTAVEKPGNYEIDGRDDSGAQYVFGQGGNTGILIHTGCHAWDKSPGPGPVPE